MEKIIGFFISSTIWYLIFSFVAWNINAFEWHWGVRLAFALIILFNMRDTINKDE
jgi:hypothetical protein